MIAQETTENISRISKTNLTMRPALRTIPKRLPEKLPPKSKELISFTISSPSVELKLAT
jgi:hypothetical protein